jgi:hypothetical protein
MWDEIIPSCFTKMKQTKKNACTLTSNIFLENCQQCGQEKCLQLLLLIIPIQPVVCGHFLLHHALESTADHGG